MVLCLEVILEDFASQPLRKPLTPFLKSHQHTWQRLRGRQGGRKKGMSKGWGQGLRGEGRQDGHVCGLVTKV